MDKHSLPDIEKFAAYLDGNLPDNEMLQFSQMAEHDNVLQQLLDASSMVDETISNFSDSEMQLPPEITGSSFLIPAIPASGISEFVTLTPASTDMFGMAETACADDEVSQLLQSDNDDHTGIVGQTDESIGLLPEDNGDFLNGNIDISSPFDNT